jgi:Family of unknown function (DUF6188)
MSGAAAGTIFPTDPPAIRISGRIALDVARDGDPMDGDPFMPELRARLDALKGETVTSREASDASVLRICVVGSTLVVLLQADDEAWELDTSDGETEVFAVCQRGEGLAVWEWPVAPRLDGGDRARLSPTPAGTSARPSLVDPSVDPHAP